MGGKELEVPEENGLSPGLGSVPFGTFRRSARQLQKLQTVGVGDQVG